MNIFKKIQGLYIHAMKDFKNTNLIISYAYMDK